MSTFAEDIERAAGGAERIEAVVIWPLRVLSWHEARPLLDYDYDDGFGAPDCHAVYVWTEDKVLWVTQYDGATTNSSAPRNPRDWWQRSNVVLSPLRPATASRRR